MRPFLEHIADIDGLTAEECLKFIAIEEVLPLGHLLKEVVEVPFSFAGHLFLVLHDGVLAGEGRDEAARPSTYHGLPHLVELIEPAPHTDFPLSVLSSDEERYMLLQSTTPSFPLLDTNGDFGNIGKDGTGFT